MHFPRLAMPVARLARVDVARDGSEGEDSATDSLPNSTGQSLLMLERKPPRPAEHRPLAGLELPGSTPEESEPAYHAFFDKAAVGMFQMDPHGQLERVNFAMARIL